MIIVLTTLSIVASHLPVIGIFTQDSPFSSNLTYIPASYIKWIQAAGAEVVPVFCYADKEYFDEQLTKLNGIVFPGGDMQINIKNRWTSNADYLIRKIVQKNQKDVFPIYGTCQGFQLLSYVFNKYRLTLTPVQGQEQVIRPLTFSSLQSQVFGDLNDNLKLQLTSPPGALFFYHGLCVTPQTFQKSDSLPLIFNVIATASNSTDYTFISFIEGRTLPFYASQFHPQMSPYQFRLDANKSQAGILSSQLIANKFIEKCRQSANRIKTDELDSLSIRNFKTQVLGDEECDLSQIYHFDQRREVQRKD